MYRSDCISKEYCRAGKSPEKSNQNNWGLGRKKKGSNIGFWKGLRQIRRGPGDFQWLQLKGSYSEEEVCLHLLTVFFLRLVVLATVDKPS